MKKFFYLLTLVAFVFSVTAAVALAQAPTTPKPAEKVNCCVKGECKQVASKDECAKLGGTEVKDCKDCKK
jgi:hypothetical protein